MITATATAIVTATDTEASCNDIAKLTDTQVLRQYEPLIQKLAYRMHRANPSLDLDDLAQEGRIAAVEANQRFDNTRGIALMTYLFAYVEGKLKRYRDKTRAIMRASAINNGARAAGVVSTSKAVSDEGSATVGDLLADHSDTWRPERFDTLGTLLQILAACERQDRTDDLSDCKRRMRERQRAVLVGRFIASARGETVKSHAELAVELGVTSQSITNAERDLIERIRTILSVELSRAA